MWWFVRYSLRIRRIEYRIAELPLFLIPVLLTIDDLSALTTWPFWGGLVVFLFLFAFGDLLNCLTDRDLDAIHKPHLSESVYGLGVKNVIGQAVFSAVGALGFAAQLSWYLDRWALLAGAAFGLFVAAAYSVEPFRLKGRGLWQLAFYGPGLFAAPMIYAAMLFVPWPTWEVMAVASAYAVLQTGVLLVNTAEDYIEDRARGVRTVIVALGLHRGQTLAAVLAPLGGMGLLATFAAVLGTDGWTAMEAAGLVVVVVVAGLVSASVVRLRLRIAGLDEAAAVALVKHSARWVPLWITSVAMSGLVAALARFAV